MRLKFLPDLTKDEAEARLQQAKAKALRDLEEVEAMKHWDSAAAYCLMRINEIRLALERGGAWRKGAFEQIDERLAALEARGAAPEPKAAEVDWRDVNAYCGRFDPQTHYLPGDVVRHRAAWWIASSKVIGQEPHKSRRFKKLGRIE